MSALPPALDSPTARARLACLKPEYAARLIDVRQQMEDLGMSPADVSDRLDRTTETARVYVRSVLSAGAVSSPLLVEIEAVVAEVAAERDAAAIAA